jgi:RNA polymerase sigma-70 factor (ECF subfamily)
MPNPTPGDALPSAPVADLRSADAFDRLVAPHRREIKLHCYRMMGSLHEADDAVQEAMLRAWRSLDGYDGRGSLRGWLYRIATNVCLDALAKRKHVARLLPDQRAPATAEMPDNVPATDVAWLEPYPDAELEGLADPAPSPEARYSSRQAIRLAFVAVIQQLPPRQRAALLLCDVLGWSAAEAAALLGGSAAAINSALQRSRETLAQRYGDGTPVAAAPPAPEHEELLGRYLQAWEAMDTAQFAALLKEDAVYTMPPMPQWYAGRQAIADFIAWGWQYYAGFRLVPTRANGEPAFAAYFRSRANPQAPWAAHSLHTLSLTPQGIARLTLFVRPQAAPLFEAFGLATTLTAL